jgi:hypothetical protein
MTVSRTSIVVSVDRLGGLLDQGCVGRVGGGGPERVANHRHALVDAAHEQHQDGEQRGDGDDDDGAADDRSPPQICLRRGQAGRVLHVSLPTVGVRGPGPRR